MELQPTYLYLKSLKDAGLSVLSGDGRAAKARFCEGPANRQGLPVLEGWREVVASFIRELDQGADGLAGEELDQHRRKSLRNFGAANIAKHFSQASYFKTLTIKELFCYMLPVEPDAFDNDTYVPFGPGATTGCSSVLGSTLEGDVFHDRTKHMLATSIPAELVPTLAALVRARFNALPPQIRRLQGYKMQLERPVRVLDAEVCFCWFQAWLKTKSTAAKGPGGWHGFAGAQWPTPEHLRLAGYACRLAA